MENLYILKDLVSLNTIQDKQNKEIIDYLESYLLNLGFKTEHKSKNLIMSIGENPKLGFLGHTDTINYIDGWSNNPFELKIVDDKIYGLGACDMKGGIAAMLVAISRTDWSKCKYGIKLYFTYDEEVSWNGIIDIVNSNEKFPEVMIFGEPTNNELFVGCKGVLAYNLNFNGVTAHSSNPKKGISANLNAINFLHDLEIFYNNTINCDIDNRYEVPYTTMNIGLINGGSAINCVSANCNATLDFRIVNTQHIDLLKNKISELSKIYNCEANILKSISPFINEIDFIADTKTAGFLTEASFIENADVKKIILGPGPVTAHEIDEYITIESFNKTINQYQELIKIICN